jgi:hypothetical protein
MFQGEYVAVVEMSGSGNAEGAAYIACECTSTPTPSPMSFDDESDGCSFTSRVHVNATDSVSLPFQLCSNHNGVTQFIFYHCGGNTNDDVTFKLRDASDNVVYQTSRPSLADTCNFFSDELTGYFEISGLTPVSA